ncbi:site-specific recombinase XerD [Desulfitispora alkaliphila]
MSELINLKINDLDFEDNLILIRDGKGGKDRVVPMIPRLKATLQHYLNTGVVMKKTKKGKLGADRSQSGRDLFVSPEKGDEAWLFLNKNGDKFSDKGISYLFKEYAQKLGIYEKGMSLHALRRSCLTYLYKEGVDLLSLKKFQVTPKYRHLNII